MPPCPSPTGTASIASILSASVTEEFAIEETKTITITSGNGNVGVLLSSVMLSGLDSEEFQIDSGNIPFKLIGQLCSKITVKEWITIYEKEIKT